MPRNRLVWRKTSFLLSPHNSTISLGSRRVSSRTEATWQPMHPLKSLINASSVKGSPPRMGAGSHAWGVGSWTSPLSNPRLGAWLVLYCFDGLWASSSLEERGLPVSIAFLPFGSLLLLGSICSILEGGGGWGAQGGDLGGRGGSWGWEGFPVSPLPDWLSSNSWRLRWGFLWIPISSGSFCDGEGWLKSS